MLYRLFSQAKALKMRRLLRSALFVPASRPRAVAKAAHIGADMLVLDLEDAVGPDDKASARDSVTDILRSWEGSGSIRAVRINALATEWGTGDLRVATNADAVILPKIDQVGDLHAVRSALSSHGSSIPIWAMIETPRAVLNVGQIAGATGTGLVGLLAGVNDLSKDLRCSPGNKRAALLPHLANIVCAARANGLYALDGVYNAFKDLEGFRHEAEQGHSFGFDGKSLIHPSQIAPTHRSFSPSSVDIERAGRIIAAFADPENAGKGVISLDGDMVERLHLEAARALLSASSENDA
jgi:citrate lyase beta subunit